MDQPVADRAAPDLAARVVLVAAVVAGAWLRFHDLGGRQLSADEGATWAAAAAPSSAEVVRLQALLNPGKLPLHELLLHFWIAIFGDGAVAMRALSALLGTAAIALVFAVARELFRAQERRDEDLIAAASAMTFAVSLITIKYSREARMYSLLLCATLAQVWFFVRVLRRSSLREIVGLVVFTAMILATHSTSTFLIAAQLGWLVWRSLRRGGSKGTLGAAIGLTGGVVLLTPMLPSALRSSAAAVDSGAIDWIPHPTLWEPVAILNKATGTFAFPIIAGLATFGAVRRWTRDLEAIQLLLLWLWVPMLLELGLSYALKPLLLERYVLSCFVPLMTLAGLGIVEVAALGGARDSRGSWYLMAILAITIAVSIGHLAAYQNKFHDAQWREATSSALSEAGGRGLIAMVPGYARNVVRYYAPIEARARIIPGLDERSSNSDAKVLIVADQGVSDASRTEIEQKYPRVIDDFRGLQVRAIAKGREGL
ncbi:MAG TPA: glycosyltransferase family 39 protein [Candidatus Binataceae bacterium]|jgi:uncharacterized membrane protein